MHVRGKISLSLFSPTSALSNDMLIKENSIHYFRILLKSKKTIEEDKIDANF